MAKSCLVLREKHTFPRLEVTAALIDVRLRAFLIERIAIPVDRVFHYIDYTVTYYGDATANPARCKVFLQNRVLEIGQLSRPKMWCRVPGPLNIADFATRGLSAAEFIDNTE